MTKKEYILHILETLKDDWELAKWLAIVIINSEEESKILDLVFNILKESLKKYSNKKYKDRIIKNLDKLKIDLNKEKKELSRELLDLEKELENL